MTYYADTLLMHLQAGFISDYCDINVTKLLYKMTAEDNNTILSEYRPFFDFLRQSLHQFQAQNLETAMV